MKTSINYEVFEHEESDENLPSYLYPVSDDMQKIAREMVLGKYAEGNLIHIEKFLREDLSINLEQLEIAIILTTKWVEANTPFDDPLYIYIAGLEKYYEVRGIQDKPINKKEEYYVIRGIVEGVANNETFKPVKVEYVDDNSNPIPRGQ